MPTTQAICVLGMHRSGTSCLTGLLENAGVHLGNVSKQNPHNKKGNQENKEIMQLHDEVLASSGGAWNEPPAGEVAWTAAQNERLAAILSQYQGHAVWAFKDPRTLFTLSAWQQALPTLKYLGTFRHPGAVAQSLHRRGGMPPEKGFELWRRYNAKLLGYRETLGFDLLCFDLEPAAYMEQAKRAFTRLGLDLSGTTLDFFEENLRNSRIEPRFASPPPEVMDLYQALRRCTP